VEALDLATGEDIVRQAEATSSSSKFVATALIVATWTQYEYRDELLDDVYRENIFQLVLIYDNTKRETWAIFAYDRLYFFEPTAIVGLNDGAGLGISLFDINSASDITDLLSGTNCGRTGTYAFKVE
jgi:hypothetical protein